MPVDHILSNLIALDDAARWAYLQQLSEVNPELYERVLAELLKLKEVTPPYENKDGKDKL